MILSIGSVIACATQGDQSLTREAVTLPILHRAENRRAELVQCSALVRDGKDSDVGEKPLPGLIDVTRPFVFQDVAQGVPDHAKEIDK